MEVASPLAFAPSAAGTKRSLACSPLDPNTHSHHNDMDVEGIPPLSKRRRFHTEPPTESLAEKLSATAPFFANGMPNKSIFGSPHAANWKRHRFDGKDLAKVVEEQETIIESLKKEKSDAETSLSSLRSDNEKIVKENQLLRKAVTIQQERQSQAETELKAAHQYRADAEEKMKKLEQLVLSLRYHLQAQSPHVGNDFMHQRPPDVF